jgi:hypothetical protein
MHYAPHLDVIKAGILLEQQQQQQQRFDSMNVHRSNTLVCNAPRYIGTVKSCILEVCQVLHPLQKSSPIIFMSTIFPLVDIIIFRKSSLDFHQG